jgi:hypothetical protein
MLFFWAILGGQLETWDEPWGDFLATYAASHHSLNLLLMVQVVFNICAPGPMSS